jgi:hypothetical protein
MINKTTLTVLGLLMMAGTAGLIYFIVRMRRLNKKEEESGNRPK